MRSYCLMIFLLLSATSSYAWHWRDLWATQNQQAQALMNQGRYKQAQEIFDRDDWRAAAAYRAGDYEQAAKTYQLLNDESAPYNQGNAFAHMGQYEKAIEAYDKALLLNPENQDAQHNRKIVADLLKKEKERQKQDQQKNASKETSSNDQSSKEQPEKNQENASKKDQTNSNEQNQEQSNPNDQDQDNKPANPGNQNAQDQQETQNTQKKQNAANQKEQGEQHSPSSEKNKNPNEQPAHDAQSTEAGEKEQAKAQWLRLIPDDPGGLMREKFLRDHLRRQHGW